MHKRSTPTGWEEPMRVALLILSPRHRQIWSHRRMLDSSNFPVDMECASDRAPLNSSYGWRQTPGGQIV